MKINIYGDSLMKGAVPDNLGKYTMVMDRNIAEIEACFGITVCNRSRFGSTVHAGMRQLERDMAKGLSCTHALLEFGGNDCNFCWEQVAAAPDGEHLPGTPLEEFEAALREMISRFRVCGVTPVLMSLPPIDAKKYFDRIAQKADPQRIMQWLGDVNMIYRYHELYSATVARLAVETGAVFIDIRQRFLADHAFNSLIGCDGIHLSEQGYNKLARFLADFLAQRQPAAKHV